MTYKRCLACGAVYDTSDRRCPDCGSPNALTMRRREPRVASPIERKPVRHSLFDSRHPQSIFGRSQAKSVTQEDGKEA